MDDCVSCIGIRGWPAARALEARHNGGKPADIQKSSRQIYAFLCGANGAVSQSYCLASHNNGRWMRKVAVEETGIWLSDKGRST